MQEYELFVVWTMASTMRVQGPSLDEAIKKAHRDAPLPDDGEYVADSFQVDEELTYERYPEEESPDP